MAKAVVDDILELQARVDFLEKTQVFSYSFNTGVGDDETRARVIFDDEYIFITYNTYTKQIVLEAKTPITGIGSVSIHSHNGDVTFPNGFVFETIKGEIGICCNQSEQFTLDFLVTYSGDGIVSDGSSLFYRVSVVFGVTDTNPTRPRRGRSMIIRTNKPSPF